MFATKCASILLIVLAVASAEDHMYDKLLGVEVLNPGLTARYVGDRLGAVFNVGCNFHGKVHVEDSHSSDLKFDVVQLFGRIHVFRLGRSLKIHATAGAEREFPIFVGAGLSLYKEIDNGYHFFLDTDLAYIRSRLNFSYYEFGYPSGQRLQIGFLKGF